MAKFDENYFKNDGMKATTIEDTLAKDEQILWRGKPNRKAYIWGQVFRMMPFALIWIIFDGAFLGCMFGFNIFGQAAFDACLDVDCEHGYIVHPAKKH